MNVYSYCRGNPVMGSDPSGLACDEDSWARACNSMWGSHDASGIIAAEHFADSLLGMVPYQMLQEGLSGKDCWDCPLSQGDQWFRIGIGALELGTGEPPEIGGGGGGGEVGIGEVGGGGGGGGKRPIYRGVGPGQQIGPGGEMLPPPWDDPHLYVTTDPEYAGEYGDVWTTQIPEVMYQELRDMFGRFQDTPVEEIGIPYFNDMPVEPL